MAKQVCRECLSDTYLDAQLQFLSTGQCSYCYRNVPLAPLEEVVPICEEAFHSAFQYVEQSRETIVYERDYVGDPLPTILDRMLGCSERLLYDLAVALLDQWGDWGDEDPCFLEQTYATSEMTSEWSKMERSLHAEARFLNPEATRILERVFGAIGQLYTSDGSSAIINIGPGHPIHSLQRARVFSDEKDVELALTHPERYLGPPPAGIGKAGRMNAKGVAVFYGATNELTAIAEVRPPVGSIVVTSVFDVVRPLRLLNLAALSGIRPDSDLSYFDPIRVEQAQRCAFLIELQAKLLMPVMPELEDQGYLITQVIADFLSTHPSLRLDGIFFPSIQVSNHGGVTPGDNVILFSRSCGVLKHESKYELEHVSLREHDEDGRIFRPEIRKGKHQEQPRLRRGESFSAQNPDYSMYESTLELDRNLIRLHQVKGVVYDTADHDVSYRVDEET